MSSESDSVLLSPAELTRWCAEAVRTASGSDETAAILADAAVQAELRHKPVVGVAHLLDYLDALRGGRLNGTPRPRVERTRAATVVVDADEGAAQVAFERAISMLVDSAQICGVAVLSVRNAFSAGELAYYTTRVAEAGLVSVAGANSPALMSVFGSRSAVTGTNPLSFALPHPLGPRVFDQASSQTAWVKVRDAAARDEPVPEDWAIDATGSPTTDAAAALGGALLPFGGVKGANIAVMIEMLATLSGGSFSLDAAPFNSGDRSPGLGLFVAAIDPAAFDANFAERAEDHHQRITTQHGIDFGRRKEPPTEIALPRSVWERLNAHR